MNDAKKLVLLCSLDRIGMPPDIVRLIFEAAECVDKEHLERNRKRTYVMHHPQTLVVIGRFKGRTPRQAALKAASRGHVDIYLRETRTKMVSVFKGWTQTRWDAELTLHSSLHHYIITFKNRPRVQFLTRIPFQGLLR